MFPVPFAAPQDQSWRDIAANLRTNALAGFSPRAFEELSVARSFAGRQQIVLSLIFGLVGSVGGTLLSYQLDVPCGPAIVLTCVALFVATLVLGRLRRA